MDGSTIKVLFAVFAGGGAGAVARFLISKFSSSLIKEFPLATLFSNLIACIILGIILFSFKDKPDFSELWKALLIIGFCGGLSTFSTFSLETIQLYRDGFIWYSILNVLLNLSLCLAAIFILLKKIPS